MICPKFAKKIRGRGRPRRDEQCAHCGKTPREHFRRTKEEAKELARTTLEPLPENQQALEAQDQEVEIAIPAPDPDPLITESPTDYDDPPFIPDNPLDDPDYRDTLRAFSNLPPHKPLPSEMFTEEDW